MTIRVHRTKGGPTFSYSEFRWASQIVSSDVAIKTLLPMLYEVVSPRMGKEIHIFREGVNMRYCPLRELSRMSFLL